MSIVNLEITIFQIYRANTSLLSVQQIEYSSILLGSVHHGLAFLFFGVPFEKGYYFINLVSCNRCFCVAQDENLRKVFVGGLHYNTQEDNLKSYYEQWGTVNHVVIMRDMNTQRYYSHTFEDFEY